MSKTLITSLLILFMCTEMKAQEAVTGPHGGRMKVAARGFRIEALGCDNYIEIYLYNEALEPLFNNGITGNVEFFYTDKKLNVSVVKYGIDGFTGKIASPDFGHYTISMVLLDNIDISADFNECVVPKQ